MGARKVLFGRVLFTLATVSAALSFGAFAQVTPPGRINYQGVVRDAAGAPLSGPVTMTFRFYDASSGGALLWEEIYDPTVYPPQVTVSGGLFTVALGDAAHRNGGSEALFPGVFANHADVYLAVKVAADAEMTPRVKAVAAPFAVSAAKLEGRGASTFANTAHTHGGGDVTTAVASATNADMVDNQHAAYFLDTSAAAQTKSGKLILSNAGDWGIDSTGATAGGYFHDSNGSGLAYVGYGESGIEGFGNTLGGYFKDLDSSGYAFAGVGDIGIDARGNSMGGHFRDLDNSGYAYVGFGSYGIDAYGGAAGGYFHNGSSGYAYVASYDYGISAYGSSAGGRFIGPASGGAELALGDDGISAHGNNAGGLFSDWNSSGYGVVGFSTYKINGTGTVSFVQNHPSEKDKVIVYACPEGDEVATYTRGTARLVNGEARVKLGETFQWVTNPDLGLTAHLTAHGKAVALGIKSLSTTELVVTGTEDVSFDYLVYGLRIGFEESSIVQEKQRESFIPSFSDHRERYAKYPALRSFNALERFKTMESSVCGVSPDALDLSRARALKEAIHEYDPATDPPVDKLFGHGPRPVDLLGKAPPDAAGSAAPTPATLPAKGGAPAPNLPTRPPSDTDSLPVEVALEPGVKAERFQVAASVRAGDVLVMIPNNGEALHPCASPVDPMVVGVALEDASEGLAAVAGSGYARVKVDATSAPILKGDLLVTSPLQGYAMKAQPALVNGFALYPSGTVIGKALESLETGTGLIRVLVMVR